MADSNLSAIAEVVPQVSYEIVGRIIPGITVILSVVVAVMGPSDAVVYLDEVVIHPEPGLSGWAVMLIIIVAYILGFVLDGIWQILAAILHRGEKSVGSDPQAPTTSFKFDVVNQLLPKAGAWLTKLYAETNATQALIIGWGMSAIINLRFLVTAFSPERLWLEIGLIVGSFGAAAVRGRITTTRETTLGNLWRLIHERPSVEESKNTMGEEGGAADNSPHLTA